MFREVKAALALRRKLLFVPLLVVNPTAVPLLLMPLRVVGLPPGPSIVVKLVGVAMIRVVPLPLPQP